MTTQILKDRASQEAWEAAQRWEQEHWVNAQRLRARFGKNYIWRLLSAFGLVSKYRGDDWNQWWKKEFNDYSFLPPKVKNAIEVGCGPYTNIRLVLDKCRPDHIVLSDPLIRTYARFKLTFVAEMYREVLCALDDHPLEELPFADNNFDLSIMINVLDHVRDAHQCMANLLRVTRPGGYVIIGQDLSNDEDRAALTADTGAVGHPIKLDYDWFKPYLTQGFEPVIHKFLNRQQGRAPDAHYGTLVFAGRKL